MSKHRLSERDWEELDRLLSKHGFGGYYDLVECLKMVYSRITQKPLPAHLVGRVDLPTVTKALLAVTSKRALLL